VGGEGQSGRAADGQSHGANSGRGLKESVQQGHTVDTADQCASQQEEYQIHQKDGAGAAQGLVLEATPKTAGAAAAEEYGPGAEEQDCQRGDLEAAGGGAGGAAHQHQKDGDQLSGLAQEGQVHRVESGGAGCDRLKGGGVEPLPAGELRPLWQPELVALEK